MENELSEPVPRIYTESFHSLGSTFDTRDVQSSVMRSNAPFTIQRATRDGAARSKVVFSVLTWNRLDYLKECIDSFLRTRSLDYD